MAKKALVRFISCTLGILHYFPFFEENLISQVGLKENAAVVDVARETGTTETLSEMKIMCSNDEKVRPSPTIILHRLSLFLSLSLSPPAVGQSLLLSSALQGKDARVR